MEAAMSSTQERLVNCFATVFPTLGPEEILRASNTSVATWDSLAVVTLVAVIEEEFGVTIAPEEYEYVVSFESVRECLEGKAVDA
jgi:acyl carrier protein